MHDVISPQLSPFSRISVALPQIQHLQSVNSRTSYRNVLSLRSVPKRPSATPLTFQLLVKSLALQNEASALRYGVAQAPDM